MRKILCAAAMAAGMAFGALAQMHSVNIVKITDIYGDVSFEIMDRDAFAKLDGEIKQEMKIYPLALVEARKQWAADKERKTAFPAAKIKPRKAQKLQSYPDEAQAQKKIEKLDERESERKADETEKEEKKLTSMRDGEQKDEFVKKSEAEKTAVKDARDLVAKIMAEKLGRSVGTEGLGGLGNADKTKPAAEKEKPGARKNGK